MTWLACHSGPDRRSDHKVIATLHPGHNGGVSVPTPSPPVVVVVRDASGTPAWMAPTAFWLSVATALAGLAWALYRHWQSAARLRVTTDTAFEVSGLRIHSGRDYIYRVIVSNVGAAGTKVHGITLEFEGGSRMVAQQLPAISAPAHDARIDPYDELRWGYDLAVFRNSTFTKGTPPYVKVRPRVRWGPGKEAIGKWRAVRVDEPTFVNTAGPGGTVTITPPDSDQKSADHSEEP